MSGSSGISGGIGRPLRNKRFLSMLTFPNFFSFARIVLIVPFIFFLTRHDYDLAFWIYLAAGLTDALDGALARLLHQHSLVGAYLDPTADKLFMTASFLSLAILQLLPVWLVVLVILRDVIIVVGLIILRVNARSPEIRPSLLSKGTTLFQLMTIGAAVLLRSGTFEQVLIILTTISTVISGLQYVAKGIKILRAG